MSAVENLITDNLPIWSSSVQLKSSSGRGASSKRKLYGVKKLRELILDLAVRGLLVPQDSNDEPASALLEKIAAEKDELISQKIIKNEKFINDKDMTHLFVLKKGWSWSSLGSLGNIFNGNSINSKVKEEKYSGEEGIPFIATKDIGYGFESINYSNGVKIPNGEAKFKLARKNSVFICAEGGSAGKKCGISNQDVFFGNKLFANELYGGVNPAFILACYLSDFFWQQFKGSMTGIIGGISRNKFVSLAVPVPPLAEQHRIVAKVDELMALCDTLEQQQEDSIQAHETLVEVLLVALTDAVDADAFQAAWQRISKNFDVLFTTEHSIEKLKETILQLAVMGKLVPQDPNDEPASVLLGKIAAEKEQLIKEGKLKKQKELQSVSIDKITFPVPLNWEPERFGNVYTMEYGNGLKQSARSNTGEFPVYGSNGIVGTHKDACISEPCIVIGRKGSAGALNLCRNRGCWVTDVAFSIVPPVSLNLDFVFIQLQTLGLDKLGKGIKPGLNRNEAYSLELCFPPLAEQHRIVAKVDELMALCDQLKESLQQSQQTQIHLTNAVVENAL